MTTLTKEDLESLSDIEVLDELKKAKANVMYYECAEGQVYSREATARVRAKLWLSSVQEEVDARDLNRGHK